MKLDNAYSITCNFYGWKSAIEIQEMLKGLDLGMLRNRWFLNKEEVTEKEWLEDRCIEFIDINNILNDKQYGFRAHHSTFMAIMQLADKIANANRNHETTIGVYRHFKARDPDFAGKQSFFFFFFDSLDVSLLS